MSYHGPFVGWWEQYTDIGDTVWVRVRPHDFSFLKETILLKLIALGSPDNFSLNMQYLFNSAVMLQSSTGRM
jgi:hypothetical protein